MKFALRILIVAGILSLIIFTTFMIVEKMFIYETITQDQFEETVKSLKHDIIYTAPNESPAQFREEFFWVRYQIQTTEGKFDCLAAYKNARIHKIKIPRQSWGDQLFKGLISKYPSLRIKRQPTS